MVGGRPISVRLAPWSVLIHNGVQRENLRCTGTIIDASHVLTSAHCLFSETGVFARPSEIEVEAGVSSYRRPLPTDRRQLRRVSSTRVDPGYVYRFPPTHSDMVHDIAVLDLAKPLNLRPPGVRAAKLEAHPMSPHVGERVGIAGFGVTTPAGAGGPLSRMDAKVIPRTRCGPDLKGILCVATPGSGTCPGDSGSGLITVSPARRVVGILTTGACTRGSEAQFASLLTASARRFLSGHSGTGVPPKAPATRWVPAGWTPLYIVGNGRVTGLAYALPLAWLPHKADKSGVVARDPATHAITQLVVFPAKSQTHFFEHWRRVLLAHYRNLDRHAAVHFKRVRLPGTRALEASARVVKTAGAKRITYSTRDYFIYHAHTGFYLHFDAPSRFDDHMLPTFTQASRTIHFLF